MLVLCVLLIPIIFVQSMDPHWKSSVSRETLSRTFQLNSHHLKNDTLELRIGSTNSKIIPDQDSFFRITLTGTAMLSHTVSAPEDDEYVARIKVVDPGHYHVTVKLMMFSTNKNIRDIELLQLTRTSNAAARVNYRSVDLPIVNGEFGFQQTTDYTTKDLPTCEYKGYLPGRWLKHLQYTPYDCKLPNFSAEPVRKWISAQKNVTYIKIVGDSLHRMVFFKLLDILGCKFDGDYTKRNYMQCIDIENKLVVTFNFVIRLTAFEKFLSFPDLSSMLSNRTDVPESWLDIQPTLVLSYWGNHGHWYNPHMTGKHVDALYSTLSNLTSPVVTSLVSPTNITLITGAKYAGMYLVQNDLHVAMENDAVLAASESLAGVVDSFTPINQASEYFLFNDAVHPSMSERTESITLWAFMCIDAFAHSKIKW